jgi:hypothetical protein
MGNDISRGLQGDFTMILGGDIRNYIGNKPALYCPDGLYNGAFPYIISYLNPKVIQSIKELPGSYSSILFSWSYSWQDVGWLKRINLPLIVGGKHAELLAFKDNLPISNCINWWLGRLEGMGNEPFIMPDYEFLLKERPTVEWLIVYSGEGCYWRKCTFCNVDYPFPYKQFNPQYVAKVVSLANKYGKIGRLSGETHTVPWLEEMESYLPSGRWYDAYARADQKDWQRLKKANKIFIGLECLSDSVLRRAKKGVTAKQIMDTILEIQSLGINVESTVILDLWQHEEEREEHYQNTLKLLTATRRAGLRAGTFTLMETKYTPINKNHYIVMEDEVYYEKVKI